MTYGFLTIYLFHTYINSDSQQAYSGGSVVERSVTTHYACVAVENALVLP